MEKEISQYIQIHGTNKEETDTATAVLVSVTDHGLPPSTAHFTCPLPSARTPAGLGSLPEWSSVLICLLFVFSCFSFALTSPIRCVSNRLPREYLGFPTVLLTRVRGSELTFLRSHNLLPQSAQ